MGGCQELKPTFERRGDSSRGAVTGSHLCPRSCKGRQPQETFSPAPGRKALEARQPQGTDSPALSHLEGSVEQPTLVGSEARQPQGTDSQVLSHQEVSVAQPILGTVSQTLVGSEAQRAQGTDSPVQDHSSPSQLQQFQSSIRMETPSPVPKLLLANRLLQSRTSVLSRPRAPSSHSQHLQCLRPPSAPSPLPKAGRRGRVPPTSSTLDLPSNKVEDPESHRRSSRGSPSGRSLVNQLPASDSPSPHPPHPDPSLPHRNQRYQPPQPPTPLQTNSAS